MITEMETTDCTHALAFCLALRLMSAEPASYLEPQSITRDPSTPIAQTRKILKCYLKKTLFFLTDESSQFSAYNPEMLMQKRVQAFVVVAFYSVMLSETIEHGYLGCSQGNPRQILAMNVPTAASIPFHLMMDIPLPFSPSATMDFTSCHLAKMATTDFLEDGEWAGFFSKSFDQHDYIIFDPPMHGIRFVTTAGSDSPDTLDLHGTGWDSMGDFSLDGTLVLGTGQILLKKVHSIRHGYPAWDWACIMTPLGIVGCWKRSPYSVNSILVWMWKVGWTTGH